MIVELLGQDKIKVIPLFKNSQHVLAIECVIYGKSPGNIFVDDLKNPKSGLIKTPEGNVIFGNSENSKFNSEISEKIDNFDSIEVDEP
jgi:hypothetical protein